MSDRPFQLSNRAEAVEAIRRMGEDDLRFLNRIIVDRLKLIQQARSTVMMSQFHVGDRVRFDDSSGEAKTGVVIRLNKKTAGILADDGIEWKVYPGFLTRVQPGDIESRGDARR